MVFLNLYSLRSISGMRGMSGMGSMSGMGFLTGLSNAISSVNLSLRCLLLETMALGGLCCYYFYTTSSAHIYNGVIINLNPLTISNGDDIYYISSDYFINQRKTIKIRDNITVVGDLQLLDDRIIPNNHGLSGIYSNRHPISIIKKIRG